jgi:hypothetical protein
MMAKAKIEAWPNDYNALSATAHSVVRQRLNEKRADRICVTAQPG